MQKQFKQLIDRSNRRWVVGLTVAALFVGASAAQFSTRIVGKKSPSTKSEASRVDAAKVKAGLINLPLVFEENRGQTESQAKFLARAKGYTAFMTPSETVPSCNLKRMLRARRLPSPLEWGATEGESPVGSDAEPARSSLDESSSLGMLL